MWEGKMSKETILEWIETNQSTFTEMAKKIWQNPQLAYEETFASELQMSALKIEGFTIQTPIGEAPTAFVAEYGTGKPVIGLLGEFDALPGLSQTVSTTREEIVPGGPGHGCGHNLLGTAGVEAAIALKNVMDLDEITGTIRYYGCPAEEVLSGKTFMARAGVFNDIDCALTWHPGTSNMAVNTSMQAMVSIKFHFKGITAHAAGAPYAGRSALDAVELMNVGANFLREHVMDGSRIHYVITNGGLAPNIVPDEASVWYYLRAATKEQVDDMLNRVKKIAEGASLMTETNVVSEILAFAYETLPNEVLNDVMYKNMSMMDPPVFTYDEQSYAQELVSTIDPKIVEMSRSMLGTKGNEILPTEYVHDKSVLGKSMAGSSDIGDVSWITPMGQVMTTCAPVGVQLHSWQATAAFGTTLGMKGMHLAAKTMALTALDLLQNKELVEKAKVEFLENTKGKPYIPGIPEHVKPVKVSEHNSKRSREPRKTSNHVKS